MQIYSEPPLYVFPNGAKDFEVNRNREVVRMNWVAISNDTSSPAWIDLSDRPELIGVYFGLVFVASRAPQRWHLIDDRGRPHTPRSIARITRLPEVLVEEGFSYFHQLGHLAIIPQAGAATPQAPAIRPHNTAPFPSLPQEGAATSQEVAGGCAVQTDRQTERTGSHQDATRAQETATNSRFEPDMRRFRASYPVPCNDLEVQLFSSVIKSRDDEELLFRSLEAHMASPRWENPRFIPRAKTWLGQGDWKIMPSNGTRQEPAYRQPLED